MVLTASHDYSVDKKWFGYPKGKENHVICFEINVAHKKLM